MSTPLIPWETCNVPEEIQKELIRRKTNVGLNFKGIDGWSPDGGDWQKYKGPMTSWVRVCSNGKGRPELNKPGFVMTGGKSFYQTYGFQPSANGNQQTLGYTPDGKEHTIGYDKNTSQFPIHVPSPEILRIETVIQKELLRRVWIHWVCFSPKQLEYMTPYFLVPRTSIIVEFGWNHFNPESLVDLTNEDKLADIYFKNPYPLYNENILKSNGNYDVVFGIVTNFEWSIEGNKISCMTEVTSKDRLYAGIPISTIVASKVDPSKDNTDIKYFTNIRKICDSNFINNLKAIASLDDLNQADSKLSNEQLYQYIKGGTTPMRKEYWRGIFYGRDTKNMKKSENGLDYKWTPPTKNDFDVTNKNEDVWVNMGFIVELLNRCFPFPDVKHGNFFHVNVDEAVIGAHPNHISCDGGTLLIPNAYAPKYMFGTPGLKQNEPDGDYYNQFGIPWGKDAKAASRKINKKVKDANDPLWNADCQLSNVFDQGIHPVRDDLDFVINANRYLYPTERNFYAFPFIDTEEFPIKNRTGTAKYDPYFYGYFKDLYINVNKFIQLVKDENVKTYVDLYKAMFDEINRAGGNFWEFSLAVNDNTSGYTVVDNRMLPSGNNKSKAWYFDYQDSDQVMTNLGFKPKMSDAQAFRTIFGETNNPESKTVAKEENDLLNYQFEDRILSKVKDFLPTIMVDNTDANKDPFGEDVKLQQHITPGTGEKNPYQFTVMVGNKPFIRRLVLPDSSLLNVLLDDHDLERNQRYTGIQPITVEVSLQGIGGLRTFMSFLIRNLPNPYHHKDVAYRIVDVHHVVQDGKWDTVIKAGIIPLRGYIKSKLGIPE